MVVLRIPKNYEFKELDFIEHFPFSSKVEFIDKNYKTIYFPSDFVYHGYDSGANKNIKLLFIFLHSAYHYFNKWGWAKSFY